MGAPAPAAPVAAPVPDRNLLIRGISLQNANDMAGAEADTLLLLHDRTWALACTVYEESVVLDAEGIAWRTPTQSRPWLVGMMRELRCGVIDVPALIHSFRTLAGEAP